MNQQSSSQLTWGWLLTTAAVVGLGIWAWETMGPDLKRYIKIESM
jgi:hypothetical protein